MGVSYYSGQGSDRSKVETATEITIDRVNYLYTFGAVISDTPSRLPFLLGESYYPLFTKFVPRLFWPGKPIEDFGNKWARRYGYLGNISDTTTSFNLHWLPEMYMNFGSYGVFLISFFLGILVHFLTRMFWQEAADPSTFAFGMTLGLPLFFVESNMSMVLGNVIIAWITLYVCGKFATLLFPRFFGWRGQV